MNSSRALCRAIVGRRYCSHSNRITYNDLPLPGGCWQTEYDRNQRRYNMHLILGVVSLAGTIAFGKMCGYLDFDLEGQPENPAKVNEYKE
ncbi:unnamed protein product [Brassicogethes aeneus]|uniref:Deltamethrin resistance protein prag01 domain-containing protein n=1 Tax=Brassicogethes aeneus TaxID=1431903 RepID=A0A9P0AT18_BRAAE|nr:unnamed protein product [Brassicogethes aeneus]